MRNATTQASNAFNQATNTANNFSGQASGVNATLEPFLSEELTHPQGYSPEDQSAMLAAGMGASGGAASGITGAADQMAAANRNAGGFNSALDAVARDRMKADAGVAEGIAGKNAELKSQQQQDAAAGLSKLYSTDTSGMLDAMRLQPEDINSEVNAGKSGWFQNMNELLRTLNGGRA